MKFPVYKMVISKSFSASKVFCWKNCHWMHGSKDFNISSIKEAKHCSIRREGLMKMLTELFPETSGA